MLLGLSIDTVIGCYIQDSRVRLTGSSNQILYEVTVTRRVDYREVILRGEELLVRDINRYSALPFFLQSVHNIGKSEPGLTPL